MLTKLKKPFPLLLFITAIIIFSAVFYIQRHFMNNFDENDHLAIGYLMKNGYLLYKDTFSHHFPLPYYWTYLFTPFWSESASRTIAVFRLSIIILYLSVFSAVFLSYKNKISKIALSLWLILISTFLSLYHGNLVLSETFTAVFITGIFWLVIPQVLDWEKNNKLNTWLLILFSSAAFWTQPLTLPVFLIPILLSSKKNLIKIISALFLINTIPTIIFVICGQLSDFLEQAVWFNFSVYSKYYAENNPMGIEPSQTIFYFIENEVELFTQFMNGNQLFQFIVNASFFGLLLYLFKKKHELSVIILLILFLLTRIREAKILTGEIFNFGILPYLLFGSACFVILIFIFRKKTFMITGALIIFITISLNNSWKIFKQSLLPEYNFHVFWNHKRGIGEKIKILTQTNERILIYPHNVDLYYFANRYPPDRFTYWFPWINSVDKYRSERSNALTNNPPAIIYIGDLDFKDENDFYLKYFPKIVKEYIHVYTDNKGEYEGIWLRNDLADRTKILN